MSKDANSCYEMSLTEQLYGLAKNILRTPLVDSFTCLFYLEMWTTDIYIYIYIYIYESNLLTDPEQGSSEIDPGSRAN